MIEPLRRSRVVPIAERLPPCWLRRSATRPDADGESEDILRVGPGGRLRQALIETIDGAHEVVLLASFLLADEGLADAALRAASEGHRVYVLTASDERLSKVLREDDAFEARMVEEHKRLLDRLAGHVVLRSAEHFHAKLVVADPQSEPRGWITTANLNKALRDSVELGVRLRGAAARELAAWFAYVFWAEAERELAEKGRLAKLREPPGTPPVPTGTRVVATTKSHALVREEVLRLVRSARRELIVSSYGFAADHPLVEAIAAKARDGVPVTVLTRPRPAVESAVALLAAAGVRVFAHDKLHAKAVLSDAGALIMSANLEARGLDTGFEVGVRLDDADTTALRQVLDEWTSGFPWHFAAAAQRSDHVGEICPANKGLRDGVRTVIPEKVVQLPPITARDALRLDEVPDPKLTLPAIPELVQRVRFEWEVRPPRLPQGATERMNEVERDEVGKDGKPRKVKHRVRLDPPVYDHASHVYVVLRSDEQTERVRSVAAELGARVVLP